MSFGDKQDVCDSCSSSVQYQSTIFRDACCCTLRLTTSDVMHDLSKAPLHRCLVVDSISELFRLGDQTKVIEREVQHIECSNSRCQDLVVSSIVRLDWREQANRQQLPPADRERW